MIDVARWRELKQQELPFYKEDKEPEFPFFENPKNDNERLLNLQKEYKEGNEKALGKIYELSVPICGRFISKIAETNPKIKHLSYEDRMQKARDAAAYIPLMYKKYKNFLINKNFPGYLYLRVQHECLYYRKVDKIVDFVDWETYFAGMEIPGTEKDDEFNDEKFIIIRRPRVYSRRELLDLIKCSATQLEAAIENGSPLRLNGEEITIDEQ